MSVPPIPQRLARRPTRGGLVVPWISLQIGDRAHLGEVHNIKRVRCLVDGLCQIDGQPLGGGPYLFLGTQSAIDQGFSSEPPMHRECGAYSIRACPMVNGQMATWAKHKTDHTGKACPDPGCDCGGWVTEGGGGREGEPSEPWFQIWVTGWDIAVKEEGPPTVGNVNGALFRGRIVRTRPIAQLLGGAST